MCLVDYEPMLKKMVVFGNIGKSSVYSNKCFSNFKNESLDYLADCLPYYNTGKIV